MATVSEQVSPIEVVHVLRKKLFDVFNDLCWFTATTSMLQKPRNPPFSCALVGNLPTHLFAVIDALGEINYSMSNYRIPHIYLFEIFITNMDRRCNKCIEEVCNIARSVANFYGFSLPEKLNSASSNSQFDEYDTLNKRCTECINEMRDIAFFAMNFNINECQLQKKADIEPNEYIG